MSRPLKLLHVASFNGNIGDNASHSGFYTLMREALDVELDITEWEIRKAYQNYQQHDHWEFDSHFIDEVNRHDACVIGGGNYFELSIEKSMTGTTIDLNPNLLADLKKPLIFNAVGCDSYKGYSDQTIQRFQQFLDTAIGTELVSLSVRNDGSNQHISRLFGDTYNDKVKTIADPGFFVHPSKHPHIEINPHRRYWAINAAVDMMELRFAGGCDNASYSDFVRDLSGFLSTKLEQDSELDFIFIPHIYSDLKAFSAILDQIPDPLRRNRIIVAPTIQGYHGADYLFSLYSQVELCIGTRFHCNVCAIGMGIPSIGITTYPKLSDTYHQLGLGHRCCDGRKQGFIEQLDSMVDSTKEDRANIVEQYRAIVSSLRQQSIDHYRKLEALF